MVSTRARCPCDTDRATEVEETYLLYFLLKFVRREFGYSVSESKDGEGINTTGNSVSVQWLICRGLALV